MVNDKLSTVAYALNPKRIVQSDGDLAIFDFLYTYNDRWFQLMFNVILLITC